MASSSVCKRLASDMLLLERRVQKHQVKILLKDPIGHYSRRSLTSSSSSLSSSHAETTTSTTDKTSRYSPIHDASSSSSTSSSQEIISSSSKRSSSSFHTLNDDTPYQLCFLRHGQSTWNRDNRFIGWTDTPLTDDGVLEARVAGQMLKRSGIRFDEVHTSFLRRSIRTTNLVLMELDQEYIPVYKHWRLNERSYGDLVGKNKKEAVLQFGKDQVKRWRRSYDEPPPPMSPNHPYHPARDPRYRHMIDQIPLTESLKDTMERSSVYWDEVIAPALRQGKTLLVVGHENNLRSLLMRLEDISPQDVLHLNLPRAVPLAYRLNMDTLKPLDRRNDATTEEATGYLRGEWLGGDQAVKEILDRDYKQVYDTTVTQNLEIGDKRDKWNAWMEFLLGKPSPYQKAVGGASHNVNNNDDDATSFLNCDPIPGQEFDDPLRNTHNINDNKNDRMVRAA